VELCFAVLVYIVGWFSKFFFLIIVGRQLLVLVSSWLWCSYVLLVQLSEYLPNSSLVIAQIMITDTGQYTLSD